MKTFLQGLNQLQYDINEFKVEHENAQKLQRSAMIFSDLDMLIGQNEKLKRTCGKRTIKNPGQQTQWGHG